MFRHLRMLMSIFSFMAFTTDPDGDPKDPPVDDPEPKDPPTPAEPPKPKSEWTVAEWEAENQRIAAKEKAEGRKAAEREYQQKQDEAQKQAELQKQESEGKYEEAKTQLTSERDTAQAERDKALELLKANVDTQWDPLPDEVKATYTGDDEDVLAKSEHIQRMKPIIDRLQAEAKKESERENPGSRKDPPPSGKKTTTEEDEEARLRSRPRF